MLALWQTNIAMKLRVSFNDLPIKHGGFPNVKNFLIFLGTYYLPRGSLEQNGKARGHKKGMDTNLLNKPKPSVEDDGPCVCQPRLA